MRENQLANIHSPDFEITMTEGYKLNRLNDLWKLLDSWEANPLEREYIENRIWERWGLEQTVMITDLSGCSCLTRQFGIIHFLSLIRMSHRIYLPIIKDHGGKLIDIIMDDLVVYFKYPEKAIYASIEMQKATHEYNKGKAPENQLGLSVGIESGSLLIIDDVDFFGNAPNIASKLGEDLGGKDDILIGPAAYSLYIQKFPDMSRYFVQKQAIVSKIELPYHKLNWQDLA